MKLLIDIDDTVCLTTPSWTRVTEAYMSIHHHKRIRYPNESGYHLEESFDLTAEETSAYLQFMHETFSFGSLSAIVGAKEFIQDMIAEGHTVEFVTARYKDRYNETVEWLTRALGVERPIVEFRTFIEYIQADVLIDNSEVRATDAVRRGIPAILFTKVQVEEQTDADLEGIYIADSYEKVKEYIKEIEDGRTEVTSN